MSSKRKNLLDNNILLRTTSTISYNEIIPILLKNGELWFIENRDNLHLNFRPTYENVLHETKYLKYIYGSINNKIIDFVLTHSFLITLFENGDVYFEGILCHDGYNGFFGRLKPKLIANNIIQIIGISYSVFEMSEITDNIFLLGSNMKVLTFVQKDNNSLSLEEDKRIDKNIIFMFCEKEYYFYYTDNYDLYFFGHNDNKIILNNLKTIKNPTYVANIPNVKYFCIINSSLLIIFNNNNIRIIGEDKFIFARKIAFIMNWCLDHHNKKSTKKFYFKINQDINEENIIEMNDILRYHFECINGHNKEIEYIYFSVEFGSINNILFYCDNNLFDINLKKNDFSVKITKCDIFTHALKMSATTCEYNKLTKQFKFLRRETLNDREDNILKNIDIVKIENFVIPDITWSPIKHRSYPESTKKCIDTFLLINNFITKNKKYLKIPKFILFKIFYYLSK